MRARRNRVFSVESQVESVDTVGTYGSEPCEGSLC